MPDARKSECAQARKSFCLEDQHAQKIKTSHICTGSSCKFDVHARLPHIHIAVQVRDGAQQCIADEERPSNEREFQICTPHRRRSGEARTSAFVLELGIMRKDKRGIKRQRGLIVVQCNACRYFRGSCMKGMPRIVFSFAGSHICSVYERCTYRYQPNLDSI